MQHLIEVKIAELNQLFNSMDPSPFRERDLDPNAEEFIVSWAQEHPSEAPLKLVVHLSRPHAASNDPTDDTQEAVRHYFEYQAAMKWREFRQLMREGRATLTTGLVFLVACQLAAWLLPPVVEPWHSILHEGFVILGWVALWHPLDIYLYRWWPVLRLRRCFQRLAHMEVQVLKP